eukprot:CAMPEP_0174352064 /NCGR_PEP_ID=MMETSP0811_2-20130205/9620_1 /TAXON_ID=73025 ORGANISM="Eutreptiella gymnastica-like, Strain CCMP1594" /NCGR_SAMPLE_ID=MMETSP0811_2 /ASSEMBLY_ACC=CAM_ASM_000667 /LENGTH=108 /DNA_ID=CAMNT_0015481901 /DNA_START=104 /DNA_END=428 /DNA_ORIENTATION=+
MACASFSADVGGIPSSPSGRHTAADTKKEARLALGTLRATQTPLADSGAEKEEREYTGNTNAETASLPTKRTVNGLEMEGSGGIWRESKGGNRREVERSGGKWRYLEG